MLSIAVLVTIVLLAAFIFTPDHGNRELREYYMTEYPEYRRCCRHMSCTPLVTGKTIALYNSVVVY